MTKTLLITILSLALLSACGVTKRGSSFTPKKHTNSVSTTTASTSTSINVRKGGLIENGVASWYGPNFHGKLTANGEVYDMDGYTAAHRTLPFGTEVIVENQVNGKKVQVRINDRGPFAKDRIIDLSRSAATDLEIIGPGTADVKIFLAEGELKNTRIGDLTVATYTIQLGSYNDRAAAEKRSEEIRKSRIEKLIIDGTTVYRVYYGDYTDPDNAQKDLLRLESKGFEGFVKQIQND